MVEPARADIRYTAFLSYSHKDSAAAARLHRRLESYRVPNRLVGSESPRGPVPRRLWPIFRDREELPAASDLSETVRTALAQSGALIILCSPSAAESLWVAEEIETFRTLHPDRPILAAILDGDPPDCFPQALRAFGRDGTWHEPLATDLRPKADGRHLGLLKLVAGITGLGLDDLVQRDASRRVRRVMAVTVAAVIAMLITAALALVAVDARRDAERERAEAERQRAAAEGLIDFMLTDLRERLRGVGNTDVMVAVNQRALAFYGGPHDLDELPAESLERRARILHAIGSDYKDRGDLRAALTAFREANRITAEQLGRAPDNPDRIYDQAQSEYWLGSVDEQLGNFQPALEAYGRYRAQAKRMNQLLHDRPTYIGELAYSESNLGSVYLNGFHLPELARDHFRQSLRWFLRASEMEPTNRIWRAQVADAHAWIADTWFAQQRYDQARTERLIEQGIKRGLLQEDPNNHAYLYAMIVTNRSLARIDQQAHEYNHSLARLSEARSTIARLMSRDPANVVWRNQAASIEVNRAQAFSGLGQVGAAKSALREALELLGGSHGDQRDAPRIRLQQIIHSYLEELDRGQPLPQ